MVSITNIDWKKWRHEKQAKTQNHHVFAEHNGSDEMVKLYTHLRPEYRKRILSTIPTLIHPELHPVHPESETMFVEQVV